MGGIQKSQGTEEIREEEAEKTGETLKAWLGTIVMYFTQ